MARRRNPYPALIIAALIPAVALGGLWQFADGQKPDAVSASVTAPTVDSSLPPTVQVLVTPILSVRRAPSVLARQVNDAAFKAALQPFADSINNTSCFAVSVDGEPVVSVNETEALRPASNVKLITAAVALEVLGAEFKYTTTIKGVVGAGGVITGNLYFVGGGDPVLNSAWWNGPNKNYPPFNSTSIEALADAIKAAGVTSITGSVVGDATRYDGEQYPPSWANDVRFTDGGPVSALLVNDSRESATVASSDPVVGAATVLTTLLTERGITVGTPPVAGGAPADAPIITTIDSLPLPAILAEMLSTSDNSTAEMVLKEIGFASSGAGTRAAGLAVLMSTMQAWGVPTEGISLVDGSGLSDDDRMTCAALLAVLQHGSVADAVGQGLAVGGAPGTTLYDAFLTGEPLSGVIRAKTGTLNNLADGTTPDGKPAAKALSGFVPTEGGGVIEFSLLLNGQTISDPSQYKPIWLAMAEIFADYPSGPTAADLGPR
ncbi:MAG: D-alanyl-D-alanine carboxypeptidase/D-alanyl-D-alanine-endopeptidase [Actinomycetia bacterium]|nr:D-alanyl-D-alanine carboxypeptidase/D-alanyl-D-alanine-endopeptidase [Actinomycetes bacterium]